MSARHMPEENFKPTPPPAPPLEGPTLYVGQPAGGPVTVAAPTVSVEPVPVLPPPIVPISTDSLPDPDAGPHRIWLIIFIVLLVTAVGIAVYEFAPLPGKTTSKSTPPVLNTSDARGTMSQLGSTLDDVDANMTPVEPSLSDQQGNLSE